MALTGVFPKPGTSLEKGPISLHLCQGECGLVQLGQTYDLNAMYGPTYGYRSGLNGSMATHLVELAEKLTKLVYPSKNDVILDIGSSDGTFLAAMPERFCRIGVDPSAEKFRSFYPADVELVVDFFPSVEIEALLANRKAKIVTSIAMFYDLETPVSFAQEVARILADDGVWYIEQSYLPRMLAQGAFDTICQEHLEYYALTQIQYIATQAGLKIIGLDFNAINGGSFGVTLALKESTFPEATNLQHWLRTEKSLGLRYIPTYTQWKSTIEKMKDGLLTLLRGLDTRPWGLGASTKGNVLLQYYGLGPGHLSGILDINPDKEGCVTPGTNIPITATRPEPEPSHYLVLPWHFKQNILGNEAPFLKAGGKLIFPLPNVEVVGVG
jgi:hypothetical protein